MEVAKMIVFVLFLTLRYRQIPSTTIKLDFSSEVFCKFLCQIQEISFCSKFIECFYPAVVLCSVRCFFWVYGSDCGFGLFILLMWCITSIDFQLLNHKLHSWDKSYLVMAYNSFYMLLNLVCQYFASILLEILACIFVRYWFTVFCFPLISLSDFAISIIPDSYNEQGMLSSLLFSGRIC